ncbi:MAG: DNA adenine methylase [Clostridia bacterium]|nr:DNA adenine methylase [Clostridia bacterium]
MSNYSPLRYPGGKSALYPVISSVIESNRMKHCIYVEPFAGGAGIAWSLLIDGVVDRVIINDADKAVYSFWRAIVESTQWFVEKIRTTPITVDEWRKQRDILRKSKKYSKELGFAMFFLNRTNRSGILDAGPIGGYDQAGEYKIDCRFNRDELIGKIIKISEYRNNIRIYNQDISTFLKRFLPQGNENNEIFVYFDPPYYEKGQRLYMNSFSSKDHERLRDSVALLDCRWIMTYDDKSEIEELYESYQKCRFSINYSLSNKRKGGELMIYKDTSCIPSSEVISKLSKSVTFGNICLEG